MKTNTTKADMHPQQNILQHKINIKTKAKFGRPHHGKGTGLFWKDQIDKSGSK